MKIEQVFTDGIVIPSGRMRHVDESRVDALAASMSVLGLQHPISVWDNPEEPGSDVRVVAGVHRLLAARKLGWTQIDAVVTALGERERRMWEIAENLHRAELTALERDEHVAEWIRLTEQAAAQAAPIVEKDVRDPGKRVSGHFDQKLSKRGRKEGRKRSGISQAARELNVPGKTEEAKRQTAKRALKVASLTEEAKEAAREVGLDDNRSALLKAAEAPPERQVTTIHEIAEAKKHAPEERAKPPLLAPLQKLIDIASDVSGEDPDHQLNLLAYAWEAADEETRRRFLRWIPSRYLSGVAA